MAAPPSRLRRRHPRHIPHPPASAPADHHIQPSRPSLCGIHRTHRLRPLHPPPQTIPSPTTKTPGLGSTTQKRRQPTPPAHRLHPHSIHCPPNSIHPPAHTHPPTRRKQNPTPQPPTPGKRHLRGAPDTLTKAFPDPKTQNAAAGTHPPRRFVSMNPRKSGKPHFFFGFRPAFSSS